jgi:uncharacterized membrane protein YebE (DUF533 family)
MLDELLNAQRQNNDQGREGERLNLDQFLSGPGALASGAALGGLAALLLGGAKPKKIAKNALKAGGVALVGGLAYKAWRDWQAKRPPASPLEREPLAVPTGSPFFPADVKEQRRLSEVIARAMINAAKADGHVTAVEQKRILSEIERLDLDDEARAFIKAELARPMDIEAVVRDAASPEIAAEIYAASILAVDPEREAEKAYLSLLAARLNLDKSLAAHIRANAAPAPLLPAA